MKNTEIKSSQDPNDFYEVNIKDLYKTFSKNLVFVFLIIFLSSLTSIFYSLSLSNIYTSEAILIPAQRIESSERSSLTRGLSGAASLVGINLNSTIQETQIIMGIETIKSLNFFKNFVQQNNMLFKIFAVSGQDSQSKKYKTFPKYYDSSKNKWIYNSKFSIDGRPSFQEAHKVFLENLSIQVDLETNLIKLKYDHYVPEISQEIVKSLVFEINEKMRNFDLNKSLKSIEFLKTELVNNQSNVVRSGINALISKEMEKIAFAKASPEYLFRILSPPAKPEYKSKPARNLIVILGSSVGLVLAIFFVLLRNFLYREKYYS